MSQSDLAVDAFLLLHQSFFNKDKTPKPFTIRDKGKTQSDPLDQYISSILSGLQDATCQSSGSLTSPDMVIYRASSCAGVQREVLKDDPSRIIAVEVKKLERQSSGQVARATGLDYNTTPPCGTVRVYDASGKALDIRSFYLFVCQEEAGATNSYFLSALALCDGNVINSDFDLYLAITGQRTKGLGLGSYGDGANRQRPMLLFPNPLGSKELDNAVTLITRTDLELDDTRVGLVYEIGRTPPESVKESMFYAYRKPEDVPSGWEVEHLADPFPKPRTRQAQTQSRGRFTLPFKVG